MFISKPLPRRRGKTIDCDAMAGSPWRAPRAVRALDLWEVLRLFVVQSAIAWTVPAFAWRHVAGALGDMQVRLHRRGISRRLAPLQRILQDAPDLPSAIQIEAGISAGKYEERFQYLRAHRPGGWEPRIHIHGAKHVEAQRQAGRGMVFWGGSFAFQDLISKIAMHRLGLDIFHYTRPVHGLSNTRFGVRFLNPVRTSVELRYLEARVCAEVNIAGAMNVLKGVVEKGGAVSMKLGNRGRRQAAVPFLGGKLELATGAVALTERWGAALLPTFTLRRPDGSFDFIIGAPLESNEPDPERRVLAIAERYVDQLLPVVKAEPLQWRGWRFVLPPP